MRGYGGASFILLFAPVAATWALAKLANARRWAAVFSGIVAVLSPIALAFLLGNYAWGIGDPDRRVAIGGVSVVMIYIFVFMTLSIIWSAPERLLTHAPRRADLNGSAPRPRLSLLQGGIVALIGLAAIAARIAHGDSLASRSGWLGEVLLIDGGLALFLVGIFRGLLMGQLA